MILLFTPPVGELVTRVLVRGSGNGIDMTICFRDREGDRQHYRALTTMVGFYMSPYHGGFIECCQDSAQLSPAVLRYFTTWEELRAIPRLWISRVPLEDWLEEVMRYPTLLQSQKDRVFRAVKGGAP